MGGPRGHLGGPFPESKGRNARSAIAIKSICKNENGTNKQINKQSSERWPWRPLHRAWPYQPQSRRQRELACAGSTGLCLPCAAIFIVPPRRLRTRRCALVLAGVARFIWSGRLLTEHGRDAAFGERRGAFLTTQVGASHTTPASPPSPGGRRRRHRSRSARSPSAPRASWARRRAHTWLRSPAAALGGHRRS